MAASSWRSGEDACRAYLAGVRWPDGFVCPACGGTESWTTSRGLWMCRGCGRQTSVTAGTIFHRSRYPLRTWFGAMWFVCSQKTGTSALSLQKMFGFGSYETAWAWLHKLRRAMVRPDRDLLSGTVEVDETYIGARTPGAWGRSGWSKAMVAIAVERRQPTGLGRARMRTINLDVQGELLEFIYDTVEAGTVIYTDGWNVYDPLSDHGFTHHQLNVVASGEPAHKLLPAVHRVSSLTKRWLAGTLHHGHSISHLDYYLDEFCFRFNRRTSRSRGMLWYRLVQQAVNTDPHPLHELVATSPDHL